VPYLDEYPTELPWRRDASGHLQERASATTRGGSKLRLAGSWVDVVIKDDDGTMFNR
jgi:hypothetical protein